MELIEQLINELNKLPGIGRKTAARLAFFLIKRSENQLKKLGEAIVNIPKQLTLCGRCCNYTAAGQELCHICKDPLRDHNRVMVLASIQDLMAIEETHNYRGVYHVLHGLISPMSGVGIDSLKIKELFERLGESEDPVEIILATTPSVDGETTALYLNKLLQKIPDVSVTQLATGVPIGSELEYLDKITLARAIENRSTLI